MFLQNAHLWPAIVIRHIRVQTYLFQNRLYIKHAYIVHRERRKNGLFNHSERRYSKAMLEISNNYLIINL